MFGFGIGLGIAMGIVFGSISVAVSWFLYDKNMQEHIKEVSEQSFNNGFKKGTVWKYRQMVAAERELCRIECKIDKILE